MAKLLFITPRITEPPAGGREMLSHLHRACLRELLGEDLLVHELDRDALAGPSAKLRALQGYVDGLSPTSVDAIIARIRAEKAGQIFLNGSNLGRLAAAVKLAIPEVEVLTFYHNVESRFFYGSLRQQRNLRSFAVLLANYRAEQLAVKYSDRLIALSARDSGLLQRIYGRPATDFLPMAIEDECSRTSHQPHFSEDYLLFVGGGFYANKAGITWFAEHIAPQVPIKTCVVGRGLEASREHLERYPNVIFVGAVDRLEPWYRGAKAVIAPIFDGSGMKTKVAEALMFGKHIIGTAEAFSGYEKVGSQAGWLCHTKEDFVLAIEEVLLQQLPPFSKSLRALYEKDFSREAATSRLAGILRLDDLGGRFGPSRHR